MNAEVVLPSLKLQAIIKQYEFYDFTNEQPFSGSYIFMPSFVNGLLFCFYQNRPVMLKTGLKGLLTPLPKCSLLAAVCQPSELFHVSQLSAIRVVFQPGVLNKIYNVPLSKFAGKSVDAIAKVDKRLGVLWNILAIKQEPANQVSLIEDYLLNKTKASPHQHSFYHILDTHFKQEGYDQRIPKMAKRIGFGERDLNRKLSNQVGVGPRKVSHIHRFNQALEILRNNPDTSITKLAQDLDYCHLGHFSREFKAFSGLTPTEYAAGIKSGHFVLPSTDLDVDRMGVLFKRV